MPSGATLHSLLIEEWKTQTCCAVTLDVYKRLLITDVTLIDSGLCYLVNNGTTGAWEYEKIDRTYSHAPDGVQNPIDACGEVPCVADCCSTRLCRTVTTEGRGNNPGITINCDNPCQGVVLDAYNRLTWVASGSFDYRERGANPYPEYDARQYCLTGFHSICHPANDFESLGYSNSVVGSIWGKRGCLNSSSFDVFNGCESLEFNPGLGSSGLCDNDPGLPLCYTCTGSTLNQYWQNSGTKYEVRSCPTSGCCGCHSCANWATNPATETFCCDGGPGNLCGSCLNSSANCYQTDRVLTTKWAISINLTVP
jgi:hypothetical protein